jgi:hypothetical protein
MALSAGLWTPVAAQPAPAPALYVTQNHGLAMRVPPGLTYCPLPPGWVGSDHGTVIYLAPPQSCLDRPQPGPAIRLFYGYNAAEYEHPDGSVAASATPPEEAVHGCGAARASLPPGLTLLGKAASGCRHDAGGTVSIEVASVYDLVPGQGAFAPLPDHTLRVTLLTTPGRLTRDLAVFRRSRDSIRVCTPGWIPRQPGRDACPEGEWW